MKQHPPDHDAEVLANAVRQEAGAELSAACQTILHCLRQLSEEEIWWRPAEEMNSVANLILHLSGNVRQWLVAGLSEAEDTRDRPGEFAARDGFDAGALENRLRETLELAQRALARQTPESLLRRRTVQGWDVSGLQAIFESVAHFRGHTQEIVHITRQLKGDDYRFDFIPSSPEQGA